MTRRSLIGALALLAFGCRKKSETSVGACAESPEETTGPFPDLTRMVFDDKVYRSSISEDRKGVPLAVALRVVDTDGCTPIAGAHVEVWHCDADGVYSEYANGMNPGDAKSTYCRGVQTADADGRVAFSTVYPGWYQGRATHIHVTVYNGTTPVKVTQLAFPPATEAEIHAAAHYPRGPNPMSLDDDMVFGDGHALEMSTVTGTRDAGYRAELLVAVADYGTPAKHKAFEDHMGPPPGGMPPPGGFHGPPGMRPPQLENRGQTPG